MPAIKAATAARVHRVFIVSLLGEGEEESAFEALHAQHAWWNGVPGTWRGTDARAVRAGTIEKKAGAVPGLLCERNAWRLRGQDRDDFVRTWIDDEDLF